MKSDSVYSDDYSIDRNVRYIKLHKIGEGAFGEVKLGRSRCTGAFVALKSIKGVSGDRSHFFSNETGTHSSALLPKASFRELEALRQLPKSPYVVKLLDIYPDETKIVLVLEYAITDLSVLISKAMRRFDLAFVKHVAIGILCGLNHIHHHGLIHRDIKPSNILFSCDGVPKIGDFGLCRIYDKANPASMSHQVATRWYRAPELLFASRHYGPEVDVWSAGAVIAETIALTPLFPGVNDIDQMSKVFQVMGSPNSENWPVSSLFQNILFSLITPNCCRPERERSSRFFEGDISGHATSGSRSGRAVAQRGGGGLPARDAAAGPRQAAPGR
jgi:cell cycle related kinase